MRCAPWAMMRPLRTSARRTSPGADVVIVTGTRRTALRCLGAATSRVAAPRSGTGVATGVTLDVGAGVAVDGAPGVPVDVGAGVPAAVAVEVTTGVAVALAVGVALASATATPVVTS